jgi:hypothetical protein
MTPWPALAITLTRDGGAVRAAVDRPPGTDAARLLLGRPVGEAARMAGMAFNLCAAAQEGAARAALGLASAPGVVAAMARETARDHALKLLVQWPVALGLAPDRAGLAAAAAGGPALAAALFGTQAAPRDLAGLRRWAAADETPAARVFGVALGWDADWGRAATALWAPGDTVPPVDFARTEIGGRPVETGLAARRAAEPLLRDIEAAQGRGILWRLAARLADAALLAEAPPPEPAALAPGLGWAAAARGSLLVRAEVAGGRVAAFARLTPTDAALHQEGALARVLAALPADPAAPLHAVASMAVEGVDPCMPWRLTIREAAHA